MEEKRKQYYEFVTLIEEWENLGGGYTHPTIHRSEEEVHLINEAANKVFDSYTRMQFIASPEVLDVVEEFYLMVRDDRRFNADLVSHFVKLTRKDLGVSGKFPSTWRINRSPT